MSPLHCVPVEMTENRIAEMTERILFAIFVGYCYGVSASGDG